MIEHDAVPICKANARPSQSVGDHITAYRNRLPIYSFGRRRGQ